MTRADIPAAVLQFVLRRIDTVTELETLLIMSAEETREWSVEDVAARVYVAKPSAAAVLHALQTRRLITGDATGTRFRFSPAGEEERQTIVQTAIAYRIHLIPITTLIHKKASAPVQEFARAFNFKKDE
jgi:hypothetical protein